MEEKEININYKKKYFKYKKKYLDLKKNINIEGGGSFSSLANSAFEFAKSNPEFTSSLASGIASNVSDFKFSDLNFSNMLSNVAFIGFKTFLSQSPEFRDLVNSGLMTPENQALMFELLKLNISHLADPSFYPIMLALIKNVLILAGSVQSFNASTVFFALKDLYNILNTLKVKYPKDFILLTTFLRNNKEKIFHQIRKKGILMPGLDIQYELFMKLISVPNQQPLPIQKPPPPLPIQQPPPLPIQQPPPMPIQQPPPMPMQQPPHMPMQQSPPYMYNL